MKKIILSAAALLLTLGIVQSSHAATTAQVWITVTVVANSVNIERTSGPTIALTQMLVGTQNLVATPASFRNLEATIADWSVAATETTAGYTLLATAPAVIANPGEARLSGVFSDTAPTLVTDFALDDVITGTSAPATASAYAMTGQVVGESGYDVTYDDPRNLYFLIDTPGSVAAATLATFEVTVTAAVGL